MIDCFHGKPRAPPRLEGKPTKNQRSPINPAATDPKRATIMLASGAREINIA